MPSVKPSSSLPQLKVRSAHAAPARREGRIRMIRLLEQETGSATILPVGGSALLCFSESLRLLRLRF